MSMEVEPSDRVSSESDSFGEAEIDGSEDPEEEEMNESEVVLAERNEQEPDRTE